MVPVLYEGHSIAVEAVGDQDTRLGEVVHFGKDISEEIEDFGLVVANAVGVEEAVVLVVRWVF